jgi:Erv1 / Alr family
MDTRFWGPSGWKLLHLITFDYSETNAKIYADFFETLPYILPCKFCRASLTDYYREYPFKKDGQLDTSLDLKRWMYDIHNCVNDKLRKQGLNPNRDPKYSQVKKFYEKWQKCDSQQHLNTFWDFLFAVGYNHPRESTIHSAPMPDCPPEVYKCKDTCEKNKWNVLSLSDRLYWYNRFWACLPVVLPGLISERWQDAEKENPPTLGCRRSTLAWLWRMRCALDTDFKDPYTSVCKKIATYSSDCGKKIRAITCRKRRLNKTVKNTKH